MNQLRSYGLITIIIIITGLFYNLYNSNKTINHTLKVSRSLNLVQAFNQELNILILKLNDLDYDQIEHKIDEITNLLENLHNEIHDEGVHHISDLFREKIEITEDLKSTNAVIKNSYSNIDKLHTFIDNKAYNKQVHTTLNKLIHPFINSLQSNASLSNEQTIQLKKLQQNINSNNQAMQLLLTNIKVLSNYHQKFIELKSSFVKLDLNNEMSSLIKFHALESNSAISTVQIQVFIFIVLLIALLFIMYLLSRTLDEKVDAIEKLNKDFDKYVISSRSNLDGLITYASKAFSDISGYTQSELVGQPHSLIRHPDMPKELFIEIWSKLKNNKVWIGEIKNQKKDGAYYWVHTVITPLFDKKGKKIAYGAIQEDITDAKEIQKLNANLQDKIEVALAEAKDKDVIFHQQARLAQMGEMLSMIAHQWRQPIAAINNCLNDIEIDIELEDLKEVPSSTIMRESTKIKEYTSHLSTTIDDFRNFYNPNKEKLLLNINTPIHKALAIIEKSLIADGINIQQDLQTTQEVLLFDNELMQVILNILKNAQDNFKDKSIKEPHLTICTYADNKFCYIEISDNGGGIPSDIIENIFDPYFSTKDEKNGTGLGLYMSKTIVEKHHNGSLRAINSDSGVLFTIALPLTGELIIFTR
jgi:PAS domain S-box-containing protein